MFFVVILLLIAFGTILGIEQYEWKKLLIKFVFAAILVNFSRVIAALIIDAAQVVMITFLNGVAATAGGNLINAFKLDKLLSFNPDIKPDDLDNIQVILAGVAAVWFFGHVGRGHCRLRHDYGGAFGDALDFNRALALGFLLNVLPQTQKVRQPMVDRIRQSCGRGPDFSFFLWLSFCHRGFRKYSR